MKNINKSKLILKVIADFLLRFLDKSKRKNHIKQNKKSSPFTNTKNYDFKSSKGIRWWIYLGILFVLLTLIAVTFLMYRQKFLENELFNQVSYFKSECDENYYKNPLITFLLIDESDIKKGAFLYIFSKMEKSNYYFFDISVVDFVIDNFGNTGKLYDFIRRNEVYLEKRKLIDSIKYFAINQMNIKIDFVVYSKNDAFYDFLNSAKNLWQRTFFLSNFNYDADNENLFTNLCLEDFKYVINNINSYSTKSEKNINNIDDIGIFRIIDNLQIRKEQARISIHNYAVDSYIADRYTNLLSNYGLNIASVDTFEEERNKTKVLVRSNYKDSYTLSIIKYLLSINQTNIEIEINNAIFSEIQIELGTKSVF